MHGDDSDQQFEDLSAGTVGELARLQGIPLVDADMGARIAAGAGVAAAAVRAVLEQGGDGLIFDREPSEYLALLESLTRSDAHAGRNLHRLAGVRAAGREPLEADLTELVQRLAERQLASSELVRAALQRAEEAQARTGCFLRIDREQALRGAELADLLLDETRRQGRTLARSLLGVPLAHKDMFARADALPSFGSRVPSPSRESGTTRATVLQRLEAAGALTLGALNMAEFALGPTGHNAAFEDCRNAWNPEYISGGSSSGSGVAVACGAVPASLGSDSGGSIRIPAAVNGVFGLKPTYGLIPRTGSLKLAPSIDVIGPCTRSVRDLALLLEIIAGSDGRDALCSQRPIADYRASLGRGVEGGRVGVPAEYFAEDLDPPVRAAYERSLALFEAAGARLVEVPVPDVRAMAELSRAVVYSEATALHAAWLRSRGERYTPQVRLRASTGLAIPAPLYLEALQLRLPLLERFVASVFAQCDVLLTPTLPLCTPRRADTDLGAGPELWRTLSRLVRCTAPFNYLGVPALSMPAGFDPQGLPIGMQLSSTHLDEAALFALGAAFQQATDWHARVPAGC